MKKLRKNNLRYRLLAALCLLGALLVLVLPSAGPHYDFVLTFLDVGQGDGILITADGCNILVDGGGSPVNAAGKGERVILPYLKSQGIDRLDLVINSHPDSDHIGGLFAVIDACKVDKLAVFGGYTENKLQKQLLELAETKNIEVGYLAAGDRLEFSEAFSIEVLWPAAASSFAESETNAGSLALHVEYKDGDSDFDVLLTGDLEGEGQLGSTAGLDCADIEVLQLPHHGSPKNYNEDWYGRFAPLYVLISVGRDNAYGHPGEQVVAYWQEQGVPVLRTDRAGALRVICHEGEVWFEQAG